MNDNWNNQYATAYLGGNFHGAHATINVWQPTVSNNGEVSIGQIWVVAGPDDKVNTMEAGWRVSFFTELYVIFTKIKHQHIFRLYILAFKYT